MENLVTALSGVLQMKPEDVTEKLKTPEGVAEIESATKGLKVFKSNEEYLNHMNTYKTNYKSILADELYKEHKINAHSSIEKQLKEEFPELANLEYKKDYQNSHDLIKKAIEIKSKATSSNEEWLKEKESLQRLITEHKTKAESIEGSLTQKFQARIVNTEINSAINSIAEKFDVEPEKLDAQKSFLKFLMSQEGVTISGNLENETFTIKDKDGNPILDDSGKPKSISAYVSELASKNIPMKTIVPAGGRGGIQPSSKSGNNLSEFATWDDVLAHYKSSGKPLTAGSPEANKLYDEWKKAHS